MADIEIHELITAEELSSSDVIAEQRENGGTWLTRKLTFNALGLFLLKDLDYASDLHTTSKKIIGAINELKDGVSAVSIGTTAPSDSEGDNRNLYIQYDATDYSVVAMYVKIEDSWRPIELGGGGSFVELTQAEYDALEQAGELEEDTPYYITDVNGDGSQFQPVIHSTSEREIGVWTDGKPLYEKTVSVTIENSSAQTLITVSNAEYKRIEGFVSSSSGVVPVPFHDGTSLYVPYTDGNDVKLAKSNASQGVGNTLVLTVQYTKSTDTAGSGTWTPQGVPAVHYSTDEKIVGTWIDGRTVYEKTFEFENPSTGNTVLNHGITNFGSVISVVGSFHRDDGYDEPVPYPHNDVSFMVSLVDFTSTQMTRVVGSVYTGVYKLTRASFTVRYLKNT